MKRFACALFFFIFSSSTFSLDLETKTELIYSGIKFKIPTTHLSIGSMGGDENFLVFKYSNETGKKFLAFTNMTKSTLVDYKCEIRVFFHDAFKNKKDSKCNQEEIESFKKIFLIDSDFGVWSGHEYLIYYIINKNQSFLFVVHEDGKTIKIDTDFLDKTELKEIIVLHLY